MCLQCKNKDNHDKDNYEEENNVKHNHSKDNHDKDNQDKKQPFQRWPLERQHICFLIYNFHGLLPERQSHDHRAPILFIWGLLSTRATLSSFYLFVELGLLLYHFPTFIWWQLDQLCIKETQHRYNFQYLVCFYMGRPGRFDQQFKIWVWFIVFKNYFFFLTLRRLEVNWKKMRLLALVSIEKFWKSTFLICLHFEWGGYPCKFSISSVFLYGATGAFWFVIQNLSPIYWF